MKFAFVVFDGMTMLDFIGVYDPITRLKTMGFVKDIDWDIVAYTEKVTDTSGITITPDKTGVSLKDYDMIVIPGGFGSKALCKDEGFLNWLRTAAEVKLKVSVCSGALLLGAAGFLNNKRATTRFDALKDLEEYTSQVVNKRIVEDDGVISSMGCSSSIDMGLYICRKLAWDEIANRIRKQIEYQPGV